jgi:hypothetical protein
VNQTSSARLERRARILLHAYPADYRRDRAEEIIATLLEATPRGRAYPSGRDSLALIAGGRHARAALNRRQGAAAGLRLALLLGAAIFLGFNIDFLVAVPAGGLGQPGLPWSLALAGALGTAAALAPWLRSRAVTAVLAFPAGALFLIYVLGVPQGNAPNGGDIAWLAWILVALGVLVSLSGNQSRLPGSWLWLLGAAPAATAAARLIPSPGGGSDLGTFLVGCTALLLAVVVTCWLATDARPALGLSIGVLLMISYWDTNILLSSGEPPSYGLIMVLLLLLATSLVIVLGVTRLLYRHAAPAGGRPKNEASS